MRGAAAALPLPPLHLHLPLPLCRRRGQHNRAARAAAPRPARATRPLPPPAAAAGTKPVLLKRYQQELARCLRLPPDFDIDALVAHFLGYCRQLLRTLAPAEERGGDAQRAVASLGRQLVEVYTGGRRAEEGPGAGGMAAGSGWGRHGGSCSLACTFAYRRLTFAWLTSVCSSTCRLV